MKKMKIAIDPGHGGKDPGAVCTVPSGITYLEKDIALAVGLHVAGYFAGYYGDDAFYSTLHTRSADKGLATRETFLALWRRKTLANTYNADVFVSIHVNDVGSSIDRQKISGAAVYYYNSSTRGKEIAQSVLSEVQSLKLMGTFSDGVIPSGKYVLRTTRMPAILVELGFIGNYNDLEVITNELNQQALAYAIFRGIHYNLV